MKHFILLFTLFLTINACTKQDPTVFKEDITTNIGLIPTSLDELDIGDEFNYILFLAESYIDPDNTNVEYPGDTLNVEVCGFRDGKFVVSERITEGSAMLANDEFYYHLGKDSVYTNLWHIRNDSLIIEQKDNNTFQSHLFFGHPVSLNLLDFDITEVEMNGWKTSFNVSEYNKETYVIDGEIGGFTYPYLNVLTNNEAMASDGDGFTFIYNRDHGIVSSSTYSSWTSEGIGWELLKE